MVRCSELMMKQTFKFLSNLILRNHCFSQMKNLNFTRLGWCDGCTDKPCLYCPYFIGNLFPDPWYYYEPKHLKRKGKHENLN